MPDLYLFYRAKQCIFNNYTTDGSPSVNIWHWLLEECLHLENMTYLSEQEDLFD